MQKVIAGNTGVVRGSHFQEMLLPSCNYWSLAQITTVLPVSGIMRGFSPEKLTKSCSKTQCAPFQLTKMPIFGKMLINHQLWPLFSHNVVSRVRPSHTRIKHAESSQARGHTQLISLTSIREAHKRIGIKIHDCLNVKPSICKPESQVRSPESKIRVIKVTSPMHPEQRPF